LIEGLVFPLGISPDFLPNIVALKIEAAIEEFQSSVELRWVELVGWSHVRSTLMGLTQNFTLVLVYL
jgi:hypothetical protein